MESFTAALLQQLDEAEALGVRQERLRQSIQKYGGIAAAQYYIDRSRSSDGFDVLVRLGRPELSMEALVTAPAYHGLFTDEQVNTCFALLCAADYY